MLPSLRLAPPGNLVFCFIAFQRAAQRVSDLAHREPPCSTFGLLRAAAAFTVPRSRDRDTRRNGSAWTSRIDPTPYRPACTARTNGMRCRPHTFTYHGIPATPTPHFRSRFLNARLSSNYSAFLSNLICSVLCSLE
ncbi:hypothetical protein B0H13DRAFT_2006447 [Mycena leptocephala]|nr:hypothetical protein B0H13DRAFT_2006447 [Mycena leptocephala]